MLFKFAQLCNERQIVNCCAEYAAHRACRGTSRFECYKCLLDGNKIYDRFRKLYKCPLKYCGLRETYKNSPTKTQ